MLHLLTLTWQGKERIKALKDSLVPALKDIDCVWHIRDNGSSDGSVEEIRNWDDIRTNLIAYPNNLQNYAQGMNFLFRESGARGNDVVMTLNNDVIFKDTVSIKKMISLLQSDPQIGLVGAKLNYTNTDKIQHCGVLFNSKNGMPYHFRAGITEAQRDRVNRYYPAVTGAVTVLTAETFDNCYRNKSGLNGFREEFFFGFEDIDMSLRVEHHLKKRNVYCGETEIFHEESGSLKKHPVHKMFLQPNANLLMNTWQKYIDLKLAFRYENPKYAVYKTSEKQ